MLVDKTHKLFNKVTVKDCTGLPVTLVKAYDTESLEATVYVMTNKLSSDSNAVKRVVSTLDAGKPVLATAKVVLLGSKLYYRDTDKEVPKEDL